MSLSVVEVVTYSVPSVYSVRSRLHGAGQVISWLYYYPVLCLSLLKMYELDWLFSCLILLSAVVIYEIGYFLNDNISGDKERGKTERAIFRSAVSGAGFAAIRVCYLLLSLIIISLYYRDYLMDTSVLLLVLGLLFVLHNLIRSRWNVLTFYFLVSSKYMVVLYFTKDSQLLMFFLAGLPLLRTLEYGAKKKYLAFAGVVSNLAMMRFGYYVAYSLVGGFLYLAGSGSTYDMVAYLVLPAYLMVPRLTVLSLRAMARA